MRHMIELAVALSMPHSIGRGLFADRKRRRPPHFPALFIAHIDRFTWSVANWIVRPWGKLVLLTVHRPGKTAAISRDLEAECRVGDDVQPWCRSVIIAFENRQIFAAIIGEAAEPIEEFHFWLRQWRFVRISSWGTLGHMRADRFKLKLSIELVAQRTFVAVQHRASAGMKSVANFGGHPIDPQGEYSPAQIVLRYLRH